MNGHPNMIVKKSVVNSIAVISLVGDLDAHSAELVHADLASIMPDHAEVLIDLSETAHPTGAGIRTLLLLYRHGKALGSSVALVGLTAELRDVLTATGFLAFFRVADSVADGIDLLIETNQREAVGV